MIPKQLFVLGLILIVANTGAALYCYGCLASTTSDCFDGDQESYIIQNCQAQTTNTFPIPSLPHPMDSRDGNEKLPINTVCVQFTESNVTPKAFTRGCGFIYQNVDICEYIQNITNIEGCSYCEENFCNYHPGTLDL